MISIDFLVRLGTISFSTMLFLIVFCLIYHQKALRYQKLAERLEEHCLELEKELLIMKRRANLRIVSKAKERSS